MIKNKKESFLQQNEVASAKYCQTKLDQISKTLKESISAGVSLFLEGTNSTGKQWKGYSVTISMCPGKEWRWGTRGAWGAYKIESRASPENLRAKHHVWIMREHGDIMTGLVFKAHYMVFISEEKCPSPTPLKWISKITRNRTEIIHFFIQQSNILCATCWGFMMQSQNLCIQGWIKMQEEVK